MKITRWQIVNWRQATGITHTTVYGMLIRTGCI